MRLNGREEAMYAWMKLIVCKLLPIPYVADKEFRSLSKHQHVFNRNTFVETMLKVVEQVEDQIRTEMSDVRGEERCFMTVGQMALFIILVSSLCTIVVWPYLRMDYRFENLNQFLCFYLCHLWLIQKVLMTQLNN